VSCKHPETSKQLQFALDICRQAGQIAMHYFQQQQLEVKLKADQSPVTVADQECERLIRQAIATEFPGDGILGEEEGEVKSVNGSGPKRKWIIDPIDGTYNYARGIPIFATLLALEEDGKIVLGVVNAPALDHVYWAEKGCGAYKNGQRVQVSAETDFAKSQFNFGSPSRILERGHWQGLAKLISSTYRQRAIGDYLNFALVFEGKAEAALEIGVMPWDLAPLKILAEEAGGRFSDLQGGDSIYTGSCLVTNGHLHELYLSTFLQG